MNYSYTCLVYQQNNQAPKLCVFHASAEDVLKWAAIERLADKQGAPQRQLTNHKAMAISRFLKDPRNCIPTAITIAVKPNAGTVELVSAEPPVVKLNISVDGTPDALKPATVIDGQHRLVGAANTRSDLQLTVVALLDASDLEAAFQFLVINHKASKVSPDHIRALAFEYNKEELEARLKTAKLTQYANLEYVAIADEDDDSPFKGLIRWPHNRTGKQVVPPAAIEGAIASIQQQDLALFREDEDALCSFFFSIWDVIKSEWSDVWEEATKPDGPPARKRLLDKIGIVCITQYFATSLIQLSDVDRLDLDAPDEIRAEVKAILGYQSKSFWQSEWASASYDTKAGREAVVEALVRINRNLRRRAPWYEEVKIVDPAGIAKGDSEDPQGTP